MIKKADKSSSYVILDKNEYLDKINNLVSDQNKFKLVRKDPTEKLKTKANKLITSVNAAQNNIKLEKVIGNFNPGYLYGTIKTHKPGNKIRPIISQITSPTYKLAKKLHQIILPYIPSKYLLKSSNDFIDLLNTNKYNGHIASLDVESLFTNVPIDDTINIILNLAYCNNSILPPKIPRNLLKQLLELCTKESPFITPSGKIYQQIEGVAMGSPLGPTFANFYMGYLEETIFADPNKKPLIYARYVDDIFVMSKNTNQFEQLKEHFQNISILKFTVEYSINNKLPFLDIMIDKNNEEFHTTVYRKETNTGACLNAYGECPERYKDSVINNYIQRAYKITKTWNEFHAELDRIKQILANNNYSNTKIDHLIKNFLNKVQENKNTINCSNIIPIYYKNQMHQNYKKDERILKEIINRNIKCIENDNKLKLIIYYENKKTSNLVIRNNPMPRPPPMQTSGVVYKFKCNFHYCKSEYIGHTRLSLERRLLAHYYNGSIKTHYQQNHNKIVTKEILQENTIILSKENNFRKLAVKEALYILNERPSINVQFNSFTNLLKLHQHRNHHNRNNINSQSSQGDNHDAEDVQYVHNIQSVQEVQDLDNGYDVGDTQDISSSIAVNTV